MNSAEIGTADCNSRVASNACEDGSGDLSLAGYRRCYGEARVLIGTHVEVSVGSLCMEN
jgi:hypothetical protein